MRGLLAVLLFILAGPAPAQRPAGFAADIAIMRDGARWTADYRLTGRSSVWMFTRSELIADSDRPWRAQSWRVETPGVRLERHGHHDVLVAANGGPVPARVRIVFTPAPVDVVMGYDPALVFTDGSVALYSEQFVAFPMASRAAVARLPIDLNGISFREVETRMRFSDRAGPVLIEGRRLALASVRDDQGDGTYVLFGPAQVIVTEAMTAIFDPQLPAWIRAGLSRSVPDIFARYAAVLGPAPGARPTVMVSWAGPTQGMTSMGGSTLPSLITMTYQGDRLLEENDRTRGFGLWFIAHEAAHFWLGNAITYQYARDAWITEGGADLLAFRTVAAVDPRYDWRAAIDESIADCIRLATGRGVASAETRGEQRAYYACGAVFALVAEASSRRPFTRFVRTLLDANRADRVVSRAEWLAALDRASGNRSLSRDIAVLLDRGSPDPKTAIASLFTRAGVAFTQAPDGRLRMR
jgi:hypothetical protein